MLVIRHPLSLIIIALLVMLGVLRSFSPPSPVEADAPDVVFSAARAENILRDLLQDGAPHPTGSDANAAVRDRIVARFESYGYEPEIQSRFQCNPEAGACSPVENIVAVKPGADNRYAILVTAHYDSVFAAPGASDDGAGVAVLLETARMMADFPPFQNDVVFLVTDSEENGLIGAKAFAGHHELFSRVRVVLNLEARGVSGPSVMFETGDGNRRLIRIVEQHVERPMANSLVYEIYKTMPNDTDFSVYRSENRMGLNFAFTKGVALYHSALDDIEHLDLGSLQHHGDWIWSMVNALGDRKLENIPAREDAGYIDLFSIKLIHYPESITTGLALFLGVWIMIAIGAAFRKEFRYRQLRWGLLLLPLMAVVVALAGYLLSWPLYHFKDLHPLEHPMPWAGRIAIVLTTAMIAYALLKLFSGRVSACAWMILAWLAMFVLTMVLSTKMPTISHIGLIPMAAFALGSVVDMFRGKSPAPLLVSSVAGFAAAAYISWYHFFLVGSLYNFQLSGLMALSLLPMLLVAMPMLLAFVRFKELRWGTVRLLGAAVVVALAVHLFLPGYTESRPRDMALKYLETDDSPGAYLVAESLYRSPDRGWIEDHGFEDRELNSGRLGTVVRPARETERLDLPGMTMEQGETVAENGTWRRTLTVTPPAGTPALFLAFPRDIGLLEALVNGELALDSGNERSGKRNRSIHRLRLVAPGTEPLTIELTTDRPEGFRLAAVTWRALPDTLAAPYLADWPDDAQPLYYGHRAEKIQAFVVE